MKLFAIADTHLDGGWDGLCKSFVRAVFNSLRVCARNNPSIAVDGDNNIFIQDYPINRVVYILCDPLCHVAISPLERIHYYSHNKLPTPR